MGYCCLKVSKQVSKKAKFHSDFLTLVLVHQLIHDCLLTYLLFISDGGHRYGFELEFLRKRNVIFDFRKVYETLINLPSYLTVIFVMLVNVVNYKGCSLFVKILLQFDIFMLSLEMHF